MAPSQAPLQAAATDSHDGYSNSKTRREKKHDAKIDERQFMLFVVVAALSCVLRLAGEGGLVDEKYEYCYHVAKLVSRGFLGVLMIGGALMRLNPAIVEGMLCPIVPPPLPKKGCVYASGLVEFFAGILLVLSWSERSVELGGLIVVMLLWCVFPANIYHAFSSKAILETNMVGKESALYARILIQFLFLGWAGWHAGKTLPNAYFL